MNKLYEWLFTEEERKPIGFIAVLFITIIVSTIISLFVISLSKAIMWI